MSTADDAPRGDSPNPGDAASYDEQLAVVRALKASGAPPTNSVPPPRVSTPERANKLPYTPSRSPPADTPRGHGSRDPARPSPGDSTTRPARPNDRARARP